ncbi:MAG: hypothetical protein KF716_04030 [Anaerolineae bacterium]|nr:hypothetical protein [Anaerolineae bacterium]
MANMVPVAPTEVTDQTSGQNNAVINPYALAELIAGQKINWKELPNPARVLEDILQTPYEELFDPKFEGPLYTGLRLNEKMQLERVRSALLDVSVMPYASDLDDTTMTFTYDIKKLGELAPRFKTDSVGDIAVERADLVGNRYLQLTIKLPEEKQLKRLARVISPEIARTISFDPTYERITLDWLPGIGGWADQGRYFNEATEFFDPIQGAVANCYFIAALSAVAWARPYQIRHMTRATGYAQQSFTNQIRFYKPDSGGVVDKDIEVTDRVPVDGNGNFIYARSSETGEIWPAVYEKAYAKLLTGTSGDYPSIPATAWGDCVWATAQLTGQNRHYYNNASLSADQLWDLVRANSSGHRTINPMTSWTYSSGDAAPKQVSYSNGNIVGSHCYTVLGWDYRDGKKYIILRNPWGNTEASVATETGTFWAWDVSWWRGLNLAVIDGTFGIEAWAFKAYFAGIGVVK